MNAGKKSFLSKEQIEQVLQATDIVHLVGTYVHLKASGKNFIGLCPFHNERTPSFVVSPEKQNYHCYGCGEFGDAIRFLIEIENYQFQEAVRFLADKSGIELRRSHKTSAISKSISQVVECIRLACEFYQNNLNLAAPPAEITDYIKQRGIPSDLVARFSLGFAKPGWTHLHDYLNQAGVNDRIQLKAGLIKEGEKGGFYDRLRNRLIFPIRDAQGRILGFAGRVIGDDLPKYMNPPETGLYKKSNILFGIHEASESIRKRKRIIIVEGYLDVLRLHEFDRAESVATCGTALNERHIKLIKRLNVSEVVLLFDGDQAGIKAADRSAHLFIQNDVDSKIVVLPEGLDPDDYFKKYSSDDFQNLLNQAPNDYEFIINQARTTSLSGGIEHQKRSVEQALELGQRIKNPIKRDLFLSKIANEFEIKKNSIITGRKPVKPDTMRAQAQEAANLSLFSENQNEAEKELIRYLIKQVRSIVKIRQLVSAADFGSRELRALYSRLIQLSDDEYQNLKPLDFPDLFVEHSSLLMSLIQSGKTPRTDSFSERVLDDTILKFKKQQVNRMRKHLGRAENDAEKQKWLNQIKELRTSMKQLDHRKS